MDLTSHLRYLLSVLRDRSSSLSYQSSIQTLTSLNELISSTFRKVGVDGVKHYSILLLRKILLTTFELLCVSTELIQDIQYSYVECKSILVAVEEFNSHSVSISSGQTFPGRRKSISFPTSLHKSSLTIEFSDLVDVYITSHVEWLSSLIFDQPSVENLLHLACFEKSFARGFLGIVATYTSMLNIGIRDSGKRRVYVSEEMFALNSLNTSWLDCLVPGAQSEPLRLACRDILNILWGKVAESLLSRAQPILQGGRIVVKLIPQLTEASRHADLESYPMVIRCMKLFVSECTERHCLAKWDIAFQDLLVATLAAYRKSYRVFKAQTPAFNAVYASTLSILGDHTLNQIRDLTTPVDINSYKSVLHHIDVLKHSLSLSCSLNASAKYISFTLLQSLSSSISSWNISNLAWLVFNEAPVITHALTRCVALLIYATSPKLSFPPCSSLHSLECAGRDVCTSLHETITFLKETLEDVYTRFQDIWAGKCIQLLNSSFPQASHWKSLGRKRAVRHSKPSHYCELVVEYLLFPVVEAGAKLPTLPQKTFVYLLVAIFYNEYRGLITSNKKLYTASSGRQLLTDHRYIHQWLTSSDRNLDDTTLQLLTRAPVFTEVEEGLLFVCGTAANVDMTDSVDIPRGPLDISLPFQHAPILKKTAWHLKQDWQRVVSE